MEFKYLEFELNNKVAIVKLNRTDVLNSFNKEMAFELHSALDNANISDGIRAVYLTANGRAFCAGQDLQEAISGEIELRKIVKEHYNPIILKIRNLQKPVICGVNGTAAGAGANIALACDIVIAAKSAKFIQAFSTIGLIPDSGGTYTLPRLIGLQRASALMMLGEKVSAEEAEKMGMIWKAVDDENLHDIAFNLAEKLSEMPTRGLALTKSLLNKSAYNSLESQLELEEEFQSIAGNTYDYNEGVNAFLEKRKPIFKGK